MSVEFVFGKRRADGVGEFTFPVAAAALDGDIVDRLKMRAALQRFAKELVRQRPRHVIHRLDNHQEIIGVEVHSLSVTFMLGKKLPLTTKQKVARRKQRADMISSVQRRNAERNRREA